MKIALAQMQMSQDIESNYQKSLCFIREAAEKGAQLVMFPEIQLTPFFPQYENEDASDYVITFNHPYVKGICDVCLIIRMLRVYVTSAVKTVFFLLRTFTLKKMGRDMI